MGKNARTLSAKLLKLIPSGDFAFAVFYVNGRLRLMQPYTTDRALVERAVLSATGAPGTDAIADSAIAEKALLAKGNFPADNPVAAADRETARSLSAALTESQKLADEEPFIDRRVTSGLAAISALARAGEKLPGRKVAVYFSGGIENDSRVLDLVKNSVGAANRGELSVYPIDLSTLGTEANEDMVVSLAMGSLRASGNLNPVAITGAATGPPPLTAGQQQQVTDNSINLEVGDPSSGPGALGYLAGGTGGRYIPAQMNLTKQVRQLIDDSENFYVATYLPPIAGYDGSFRAVRVKPLQKGVFIHARSGYFAVAASDSGALRPFEMPLLALMKQPQPPAEFSFRSRVMQLGPLPGGLTQELVVEVPISELQAKRDPNAGLFSVRAAVFAQVLDSSGAVVEQFGQEFNRRGALDTWDAVRNQALSFQRSFSAPPGAYTVKVAVSDRVAEKASVAQSQFQLAAPKAAPFLSDLVLVRRLESNGSNATTGASASAHAADDSLGDPLQSTSGQVVPNLDGTIRAGTKEVSLFFLIHPGPSELGKASMEISVARDGHVVGHAPLAFREAADNGPITYFSTLGTRSMSSGEYQVTVRLTQGGQSFERAAKLRIEGPASGPEIASAAAPPSLHADASAATPEISGAEAAAEVSAELPALEVTPDAPGATVQSEAENTQRLEQARKRALDYAAALPNFFCVETTSRSVDPGGKGKWKRQDTLSELLTYRNRVESRKMLAVDGQESHSEPDPTKGMVSHGEFGGVLNAIFDPAAHAVFTWKQSGLVGGEHVDVYEYKIAAKNSSFTLTGDNNWQYNTAFHGLVSIDSATLGVRQLTAVADDLPKDFSIHASAMRVDYDYIAINGHDYLLPTQATIALLRHKHEGVLNEIQFRDYKRFGAKARMLTATP